MASELPDHHILSVELLRTQDNETLAVFTIVKDRRPVQYVLTGDAAGANLRALVTRHSPPIDRGEAFAMTSPPPRSKCAPPKAVPRSETGIHVGHGPPKQPPPRGIPPVDQGQSGRGEAFAMTPRLPSKGAPLTTLPHVGQPPPKQPVPRGLRAPDGMVLASPPSPSDSASAEGIALGEPPPKQPPTPGVVAMGQSLMPMVFNLSEWALRDPEANR